MARFPIITPWGEELYPEDFAKPTTREYCEPDECPDCGRFLPDCECPVCEGCGNVLAECECDDGIEPVSTLFRPDD